jgi:hypothetical protein
MQVHVVQVHVVQHSDINDQDMRIHSFSKYNFHHASAYIIDKEKQIILKMLISLGS